MKVGTCIFASNLYYIRRLSDWYVVRPLNVFHFGPSVLIELTRSPLSFPNRSPTPAPDTDTPPSLCPVRFRGYGVSSKIQGERRPAPSRSRSMPERMKWSSTQPAPASRSATTTVPQTPTHT